MSVTDGPVPEARPSLRTDEWRAGLGRLGVAAAGVVAAILLLWAVFLLTGSGAQAAFGAGAGVVGILLVLGGLGAFTRTSMVRRDRGEVSLATAEDRRDAETLALGLFGSGIAVLVLALALG